MEIIHYLCRSLRLGYFTSNICAIAGLPATCCRDYDFFRFGDVSAVVFDPSYAVLPVIGNEMAETFRDAVDIGVLLI